MWQTPVKPANLTNSRDNKADKFHKYPHCAWHVYDLGEKVNHPATKILGEIKIVCCDSMCELLVAHAEGVHKALPHDKVNVGLLLYV